MSQKVKQAEMHSDMFVPGADPGNVRKELNANTSVTNRGIDMSLEGHLVTLNLPQKNGTKILTVLVPVSNFKYLIVEAN